MVGFADDVAIVIVAHNFELLEAKSNQALEIVRNWLSDNGLWVAKEKSEAVVLTRKWAYRNPVFIMDGCQVPIKSSIRYLGVQLDTRRTFTQNVNEKASAARNTEAAIGRLMPNVQGPSTCNGRLLMSVVNSKILYAAPIVFRTEKNREALMQVQRVAALRVPTCYRAVSGMAGLARMILAHLLAGERLRVKEILRVSKLAPAIIRAQKREKTGIHSKEYDHQPLKWTGRRERSRAFRGG